MERVDKVNTHRKSVIALVIMFLMSGIANLVSLLSTISGGSGKWDSIYIERAVNFYQTNITARIREWLHDLIVTVHHRFDIDLGWLPVWLPEYLPLSAVFSASLIYAYCYLYNITAWSLISVAFLSLKNFFRSLFKAPIRTILGLFPFLFFLGIAAILYSLLLLVILLFAPVLLIALIILAGAVFVGSAVFAGLMYLGVGLYFALVYVAVYVVYAMVWLVKSPRQLLVYLVSSPRLIINFVVDNKIQSADVGVRLRSSFFARIVFVVIMMYLMYLPLQFLFIILGEIFVVAFTGAWSIDKESILPMLFWVSFIIYLVYYIESKKKSEYALEASMMKQPYYVFRVETLPADLLKLGDFWLTKMCNIYSNPRKNEFINSAFDFAEHIFYLLKLIFFQYFFGLIVFLVAIVLYIYYGSGSIAELIAAGDDIYKKSSGFFVSTLAKLKEIILN